MLENYTYMDLFFRSHFLRMIKLIFYCLICLTKFPSVSHTEQIIDLGHELHSDTLPWPGSGSTPFTLTKRLYGFYDHLGGW